MSAWLCWLQWVAALASCSSPSFATSSPPHAPPMYLRRDGDLADLSSFEGREDPPGYDGGVSPRPLYSAAFSASQTSFLARDGAMSGPFSPIPNEVALERSILPMEQHTSHSYGLALSSGLDTNPSCPGTMSSFSSLSPSITNDSMGFIHKRTPAQHSSSGSLCSVSLHQHSPPQAGKRHPSFGALSSSDYAHYTAATPDSSCLGEKFEGYSAAMYEFDHAGEPEDDDYLHTPDPIKSGRRGDDTGTVFTKRGAMNVGFLFVLSVGLLLLFAGYPVLTYFRKADEGNKGGFNVGGTNASGQVPFIPAMVSLIDKDTPREAYTKLSADGKKTLKLVFSDEFNVNGRSFYPGDDPFWEAVDLNYWGTQNYEWYDPAAITTRDGSLVITLSETPDHNLNFRGGMVTTWNKMCFTGGQIEVRAVLPGSPDVSGLWPAAWTMGNLGRAGYGATTDGMWPYTYDSCDVGTLANQTFPKSKGGGPVAAETTGVYVDQYGPGISYLPGQRLSRCTCPSSTDHPGPRHADGSFVGRSAPEIDIIEAQASNTKGDRGHVSMSLQLAPYDSGYNLTSTPGSYEFYDPDAELNSYTGAVYQQAASGLVQTKREVYEDSGAKFDTWGYEYKPGGLPGSYITWMNGGKAMWRLNAQAMGPNAATEIGQRLVPPEPMYILLNLGISSSFTYVNWDDLQFPAKFLVDYVRIWQPESEENIGCDPPDFPTKDYIDQHWEAYNNANLTIWSGTRAVGGFGQPIPGNTLLDEC